MSAKTKNLRHQAQELGDQLRDQLAPHVESARDQLGPVLADARDKAAPHVAEARERLVNDVIPAVQSAIADAREQAGPATEEARRRGFAAAAALKGDEPVRKRGRKRKLLALLTLAGAAAVAARKLIGGGAGSHASYSPPAPTGPTSTGVSADAGGASPEEALSDLSDEPHDVTTPDNPAKMTPLSDPPEA